MARERELLALLEELLTHDEKGYGPWTGGMRRRVRAALNLETETANVNHEPT